MKTTIHVTEDDIHVGKKGSCRECPIARAIDRDLNDEHLAFVSNFVGVYQRSNRHCVDSLKLPMEAKAFIRDFDGGLSPEPLSFEMDIPAEFLRIPQG